MSFFFIVNQIYDFLPNFFRATYALTTNNPYKIIFMAAIP